jgi:hypothetical protein
MFTKFLFSHWLPLRRERSWRRGRDSNPRRPLSRSGFQDRRNRPLCHLSGFCRLACRATARSGEPSFVPARLHFTPARQPRSRFAASKDWQGVQDLNLQPTVLETATLPIELTPYSPSSTDKKGGGDVYPRTPKSFRVRFRRRCPSPGRRQSYDRLRESQNADLFPLRPARSTRSRPRHCRPA